jgi:hypothetical protein
MLTSATPFFIGGPKPAYPPDAFNFSRPAKPPILKAGQIPGLRGRNRDKSRLTGV